MSQRLMCPKAQPCDADKEPEAKRLRVDDHKTGSLPQEVTLDVRRNKLEARYIGRKFLDGDDSKVRTIERIEYDAGHAVWIAVTKSDDSEEQPYYLNVASGMDAMIEAYRQQERTRKPVPQQPGPGSTIEVLWEIYDEQTEESQSVWWRADVLERLAQPHSLRDGDESVDLEVWRVRYDARPELSEPDPAEHKVCFLSKRALFDVTDEETVMQWRFEGASDEVADLTAELMQEDAGADAVKSDVDDLVDTAVQGALEGQLKTKFDALPRDRQCAIADLVVNAKNKLKAALAAHVATKSTDEAGERTVTPEDIATVVDSLKSELGNLPALLNPNRKSTQPAF